MTAAQPGARRGPGIPVLTADGPGRQASAPLGDRQHGAGNFPAVASLAEAAVKALEFRHRMRKAHRRPSGRDWIRSGAAVAVKSCAKRYGTDRCTAYEDLAAIGFPLAETDRCRAVRPGKREDSPVEWYFNGAG